MRDGIQSYFAAITALQTRVIEGQHDLLHTVAEAMVATIERDGRLYTFGVGHSHLLALEGHHRGGGLVPVVPIVYSGFTLNTNATLGTILERTAGLARPLLERYAPQPGDMLFVFSNSGVSTVPVEMALAGKARGVTVVAVCSLAYSRVAPLSPVGQRLFEIADYVIDNGGEPGDGLIPLNDVGWRVGPSSTVTGALLWNCLVTEVAFRLQERSGTAPVYVHTNMPGGDAHNAAMLKRWGTRNPYV